MRGPSPALSGYGRRTAIPGSWFRTEPNPDPGLTPQITGPPTGSFLSIFCVSLALFVSTGTVPQGTVPQGTLPQVTIPQAAPPHRVAADPAPASAKFSYQGTDILGIRSYRKCHSAENGMSQTVRVLTPVHPASGVSHNFLIVLPVEAGLA